MNPRQELSIKLLELHICGDNESYEEKKKEILAHVDYMLEEARQDGYEKGHQEGENQYYIGDIGS